LIDIDREEIISEGFYAKDREVCEMHPTTKWKLKGTKLPFIKESVELVKNMAKVVPELSYIGWDVAITPSGPVIVEGNGAPLDIYTMQIMYERFLNVVGLKKEYNAILDRFIRSKK
jgi:hypothetical protein